jgi:hypothetical protein
VDAGWVCGLAPVSFVAVGYGSSGPSLWILGDGSGSVLKTARAAVRVAELLVSG